LDVKVDSVIGRCRSGRSGPVTNELVNVIHGRAANTTEVRIFAANHPIFEVFQPPVSLIRLSTS
jgi:hypothetical protein